MFQCRVWMVLTVAAIMYQNVCFTFGATCVRQKLALSYSYDHYNALMGIHTGYSMEMKPFMTEDETSIDQQRLRDAIHQLYNQLMCCFTFSLLHYVSLLKGLFLQNDEQMLTELIACGDHTVVYLNDICRYMLNTMYNFGKTDVMGPLWLVYMLLKYLKSIEKSEILSRRENILNDITTVYDRLTRMHDKQNCRPQNKFNDQYGESDYSKHFEALRSSSTELIVGFIASVNTSLEKIMDSIYDNLKIEQTSHVYFSKRNLSLSSIWMEREGLARRMFVEFAEMSQWENTSAGIANVLENKQFGSVHELIENVSKLHRLVTNLVKYILLFNFSKYLTVIKLSSPRNDNDTQSQWQTWTDDIESIHESMAISVEKIILEYNLKDDSRLRFLKSLIDMPANSFTDGKVNEGCQIVLTKYLDEIYASVFEEFGCKTKIATPSSFVSAPYLRDRMLILNDIIDKYRIEYPYFNYNITAAMKYGNLFESVFSNIVLSNLSVNLFVVISLPNVDFNVIRSFIDFSDEFLGTTSF